MANDEFQGSNADGFPDAEEVIRRLGGIRPAAAKLGVPVTTVQGWKNRGRIPENRHAEVSRTLHELGISEEQASVAGESSSRDDSERTVLQTETTTADVNSTENVSTGASTKQPTEDPEKTGGPPLDGTVPAAWPSMLLGGAGVVLSIFSLALITLIVYRPAILSEFVGGNVGIVQSSIGQSADKDDDATEGFAKQLQALSAAQSEIVRSAAAVQERVDKLEQRLTEMSSSTVADNPTVAGLRSDLGAIDKRLEEVSAKSAESDNRLAEAASRSSTELSTRIETLKSTVSDMQTRQDIAAKKASESITRHQMSVSGGAIQLIAIGQLEAALKSGGSYKPALARVTQLLGSAPEIIELLEALAAHADGGVASLDELKSDFRALSPILSAGKPPPGGWNLIDGAWARVKGTIGLRRIDDDSPSPVTIVERALVRGDLKAVLTQTQDYGAEVDRWRDRVAIRLNVLDTVGRLQESISGVAEVADKPVTAPLTEKAAQ